MRSPDPIQDAGAPPASDRIQRSDSERGRQLSRAFWPRSTLDLGDASSSHTSHQRASSQPVTRRRCSSPMILSWIRARSFSPDPAEDLQCGVAGARAAHDTAPVEPHAEARPQQRSSRGSTAPGILRFSSVKGTSIIRKRPSMGHSSRPMPRALSRSQGGGGTVSQERGTPVDLEELISALSGGALDYWAGVY